MKANGARKENVEPVRKDPSKKMRVFKIKKKSQ
jgi:hypothetical protein